MTTAPTPALIFCPRCRCDTRHWLKRRYSRPASRQTPPQPYDADVCESCGREARVTVRKR